MDPAVITSDFLTFRSGITNLYLLPHEGEYILVDAGVKKKTKHFFSFLQKKGIQPGQIRYIILTHTHYDHTGGLGMIRELTHAQVILHTSEAGYLREGYTPPPQGTRISTRVVSFLGNLFPGYSRYDPAVADILWDENGYRPDDFPATLLHTPGHTEGSATVIWQERAAFVGDTLFGYEKEDCMPWFANDLQHLQKSWQLLLDTPCEWFYPAHGHPVARKVLENAMKKHFPESGTV